MVRAGGFEPPKVTASKAARYSSFLLAHARVNGAFKRYCPSANEIPTRYSTFKLWKRAPTRAWIPFWRLQGACITLYALGACYCSLCSHEESNSRHLVYETSGLPLTYGCTKNNIYVLRLAFISSQKSLHPLVCARSNHSLVERIVKSLFYTGHLFKVGLAASFRIPLA